MWGWGDATILNGVFSIDLIEKGTFQQRLEGPGGVGWGRGEVLQA